MDRHYTEVWSFPAADAVSNCGEPEVCNEWTVEKCVLTERQSKVEQKLSNWLDHHWILYIPLWLCTAPI